MQYVMKRFSDLGNYLSETSKYANIEMTMVAKMKLIYPLTITNMGRTIMCISQDQMGRESQSKKNETRAM